MIATDTRNWFAGLALHRSDTFRKLLPLLALIGLFTWGVAWLEMKYLKLSSSSMVGNLPMMHSLLGFVISLLLVFRTNTAYDRWWEGRKLWGQLVNTSRNLALLLDAVLPPEDQGSRGFFARSIGLFAHELRVHLQRERTRLELDAEPHPEIPDLDRAGHVPAQVVDLLQQRLHRMRREGRTDMADHLVLQREVVRFMEICGACERIKNTPIPWSYSTFIKKFIVVYTLTMPFGFAFALGYIAIPVVMFIFYALASLELIAEEIEDPFGIDANDLPMERIATQIASQVGQVLQGPQVARA